MKNCLLLLSLLPVLLFGQGASRDKLVVLIVGAPGSGKTTQANKLKKKYRVPSISMADVLKKSAGWGTAGSRKQLKAQVESGELVSDEIANQMIRDRLFRGDASRGFILDGYPASSKQADFLDALLKERGLPEPLVVHLQAPDSEVTERMRKRGRADDKPATMERRLADYHREAEAILKRYPGEKLISIDGTGSPTEVWRAIETSIESRRAGR